MATFVFVGLTSVPFVLVLYASLFMYYPLLEAHKSTYIIHFVNVFEMDVVHANSSTARPS